MEGSARTMQQPDSEGSFDIARGLRFALAHLAVAIVVQIESYVLYVGPHETAADILRFGATLPFLQLQHGLVALVPGSLAALRHRVGVALASAMLLVLNLWVVLDQIVYRLFFTHTTRQLSDTTTEDLPAALASLWGSLAGEIDLVVGANLALAVATLVWALLIAWPQRFTWPQRRLRTALAVFGALSVVAAGRASDSTRQREPCWHGPRQKMSGQRWSTGYTSCGCSMTVYQREPILCRDHLPMARFTNPQLAV